MVFSRVSILHWSLSAVIQLWDTHQHHRREKSQSAPGAIHSMLRLSNCYNHSVILASAALFELCLSHSQCQCWITLLWRIFDCCRGAVITLPINNKQVFHLRGFIYGWILLSQGRPIFNHIQPIPARWPPHYTPPNTLLLCRNSATYWITSQLQMRTGKKRRFMLVESLVCRIQLHING